MTRKDLSVVGQVEKPFNNDGSQLHIAAPGEVGAADALAEKCVTSEDPTFDLGIEADAADSMTRRADDLQGALPHLDDFAVLKVTVRQLAVAHKRQTEHLRLLTRAEEVVFHVGVRRHGDAIALFHCRIASDMVDMAVRVDDHQRLEVMAVDEAEEFVLFARSGATRVDDNTFFGVVVINDISVFRKGIKYELFEFKHNDDFRGKGRDFSAVI